MVPKKEKFLLALDNKGLSNRVVKYVGEMIGKRADVTVVLFHVLDPVPPGLREFRGAEDPAMERKLDHELDAKWEQWARSAKDRAQPIFDRAQSSLVQAGVPDSAIRTEFWLPVNWQDFVTDVLKAGKSNGCGTIVVGRRSFAGWKRIFSHSVADELVRRASGFTVWVVEHKSP